MSLGQGPCHGRCLWPFHVDRIISLTCGFDNHACTLNIGFWVSPYKCEALLFALFPTLVKSPTLFQAMRAMPNICYLIGGVLQHKHLQR